jgi:uncharacterized protein (DUF305 family)
MKRPVLSGLVMVLVVFLGAGCYSTTTVEPPILTERPADLPTMEPTGEAMTDEPMDMADEAPIEALFIDGMIPHHQQAIEMAQQALEEAEHEELRQMAQQIIDAQQAEIEQLQGWRDDWYMGIEPSVGMQMDTLPMPDEMALSTDESIPFDLRFIDAMIIHHQGAIVMAQELLKAAVEHEELRQLAQQIIDAQQAEIEQLQQWREEWYQGGAPQS